MRESELEKILVQEVKNLGGRAYKWVSPGNDGVPDRIVILPDKTPIFAELKTDKGKLSSLQKVQCKRLIDLGQNVEVIYGLEGLLFFFQLYGYKKTSKELSKKYRLGEK